MKRAVINWTTRREHHLVSGNTYLIDRRLERRGQAILLERTYVSHPETSAIRSVLLPELNLWVIFYEAYTPPHSMNCYMHMARIIDEGAEITIEDLYLDVILMQDGRWQLVDVDEFRQAVACGELDANQVQAALLGLEHACRLVHEHGLGIEAALQLAGCGGEVPAGGQR